MVGLGELVLPATARQSPGPYLRLRFPPPCRVQASTPRGCLRGVDGAAPAHRSPMVKRSPSAAPPCSPGLNTLADYR